MFLPLGLTGQLLECPQSQGSPRAAGWQWLFLCSSLMLKDGYSGKFDLYLNPESRKKSFCPQDSQLLECPQPQGSPEGAQPCPGCLWTVFGCFYLGLSGGVCALLGSKSALLGSGSSGARGREIRRGGKVGVENPISEEMSWACSGRAQVGVSSSPLFFFASFFSPS